MSRINIEDCLCIIISLMILNTGLGMLHKSMSKLLGTRIDKDTKKKVYSEIISEDEVYNVSNLVIHNYGENHMVGSVDIEVDDSLNAAKISLLSRRIINKINTLGVHLTSVGISGTNTHDPAATDIWDRIIEISKGFEGIIRVHSFVISPEDKEFSFYIVIDYSLKNRDEVKESFYDTIHKRFPEYKVDILTAIDT